MKIGRKLFVTSALLAIMGLAQVVQATPTLTITGTLGGTVITPVNAVLDEWGMYTGSVGDWNLTLWGSSEAVPGGAYMLLGGMLDSSAAGSLNITFTDGGFSGGSGLFLLDYSLDADYLMSGVAYKSVPGLTLGPSTLQGPGAFSGSPSMSHGVIDPYSMTLEINVVHNAANRGSSFSLDAKNITGVSVPEPLTLTLLGTGLLGLAALRRRIASR